MYNITIYLLFKGLKLGDPQLGLIILTIFAILVNLIPSILPQKMKKNHKKHS